MLLSSEVDIQPQSEGSLSLILMCALNTKTLKQTFKKICERKMQTRKENVDSTTKKNATCIRPFTPEGCRIIII